MDIHRFEGIKIDLDRCSPDELANLEAYTQARLERAAADLGAIAAHHYQYPNVIQLPTQLTLDYNNGPEAA